MELPKNITQIGEVNPFCKVYVEDYVISYLKQLNRVAVNKDIAVAVYGQRRAEGEVTYLFLYGACKLNFLQRETRHLSQAQKQEIEKLGKRYFPKQEFLGYRLLNGEMIEGFHICEQDICRYIAGYAQFYEKNESMLSYMLDTREQEVLPETVDSEKYEAVKRKQEARRQEESRQKAYGEGISDPERKELAAAWRKERTSPSKEDAGLRKMKLAAAGVFALLCLAGISNLKGGAKMGELQMAAREVVKDVTEQKIPDAVAVNGQGENGQAQNSMLIAEEKLTEAVQKENQTPEMTPTQEPAPTAVPENTSTLTPEEAPTSEPVSTHTQEDVSTPVPEAASTPAPETVSTPASGPQPVSYTIQKGDTLIAICLRSYGTDTRLEEVCQLNGIADPDDIKVGEKILLPQ